MKKEIIILAKTVIDYLRVLNYVRRTHTYNSPLNIENQPTRKNLASVLCNGPSLKDALPNLVQDGNTDFVVVNYFGLDENFIRLKPKYYCLADGMFFDNSDQNKFKGKIESLRAIINDEKLVNWELTIFVPSHFRKIFLKVFPIYNKYVNVVGVNTIDVNSERIRFKCYKRGWACPMVQTVANMAIFALINLGYKHIELYGVDHTFTEGLCVDDNNVVCHTYRHYYNDEVKGN